MENKNPADLTKATEENPELVTQEVSIEDLEKDTKHIMEKQIQELTHEIEDIGLTINNKLEKLRLGVLQKTIDKVIKAAFEERLDKITEGMKSRFSLELKKVILEKFFTTELSNIKEKIIADMNEGEYNSADGRWAKAKELLAQFTDSSIKMQWLTFENTYLMKKRGFQSGQQEIKQKLDSLEKQIRADVHNQDFAHAEGLWIEAKKLLADSIDTQLKERWDQMEVTYLLQKKAFDTLEKSALFNDRFAFNESIDILARAINALKNKGLDDLVDALNERMKLTFTLQDEYKVAVQRLLELEAKYEENYSKDYLKASIEYCDKIIEVAQKIKNSEKIEKYKKRKDQIQKRIEYQKQYHEEETQRLLEKAQSIGKFMDIEANVLPVVDDYSIIDLIGNLSTDANVAMSQIANLLKEHRVKIKNELDSSVFMRSESGEVFEEEGMREIHRSEDDDQIDVLYQVQTAVVNPFDESIEEAFLKDLVPYNFEIMNVHVNGKLVEEKDMPAQELTKEGMVFNWEFSGIPTKERVEIVYDLRRRISRTILFYLQNELRVIKTHSKLEATGIEGLYKAAMPFANKYGDTLRGVIVEDIIPLYYMYYIKRPAEIMPAEVSPSRNGDVIRWDIGNMAEGGISFDYKLLELYIYEDLKIKMSGLSSNLMEALHSGELNEVTKKNIEINKALDLLTD